MEVKIYYTNGGTTGKMVDVTKVDMSDESSIKVITEYTSTITESFFNKSYVRRIDIERRK